MQENNEYLEQLPWDPFTTKREPKVTIGFKAAPHLKTKLSAAASALGFTTSEFIESLLLNFQDIKTYDKNNDGINELSTTIEKLKAKIAFYECAKLKALFNAMAGETGEFVNLNGQPVSLKVNTIEDAYLFIVNSFNPDEK